MTHFSSLRLPPCSSISPRPTTSRAAVMNLFNFYVSFALCNLHRSYTSGSLLKAQTFSPGTNDLPMPKRHGGGILRQQLDTKTVHWRGAGEIQIQYRKKYPPKYTPGAEVRNKHIFNTQKYPENTDPHTRYTKHRQKIHNQYTKNTKHEHKGGGRRRRPPPLWGGQRPPFMFWYFWYIDCVFFVYFWCIGRADLYFPGIFCVLNVYLFLTSAPRVCSGGYFFCIGFLFPRLPSNVPFLYWIRIFVVPWISRLQGARDFITRDSVSLAGRFEVLLGS